jgi:hypothetical protein
MDSCRRGLIQRRPFGWAAERPERWVTHCTGHMGDTSFLEWGGSDALEGVFGHGRKAANCGSPAGQPAVWWLHRGIGIERIQPGHPQQNGRHELLILKVVSTQFSEKRRCAVMGSRVTRLELYHFANFTPADFPK